MSRQDRTLNRDQVVVGISGGVDSSVAALLLQQAGYTVHGVAFNTWRAKPEIGDVLPRARQTAAHLKIPLVYRDLQETFYEKVVSPFLDAYAQGRTPNPCVFCNPTLKFATLLEAADQLGVYWIATGHYARVVHSADGPSHLLRGAATQKDQSYALYRLTQPTISRLQLPLGDLRTKSDVRAIARRHGLPAAEADDSQDLCFALGSDYQSLVAQLRPEALAPGTIVDEEGTVLGQHEGLPRYTVGQRSGLGIAASERLYVLSLDAETNTLTVGPRESLQQQACTIQQLTFIAGTPPAPQFDALARIRYRAPLVPAEVKILGPNTAHVGFTKPQIGVAPGQSLVLYRDDEVLGGGVIGQTEPTPPEPKT